MKKKSVSERAGSWMRGDLVASLERWQLAAVQRALVAAYRRGKREAGKA